MAKRLNICTKKPLKDGKSYWPQVGSLWVGDDGEMNIILDVLPLPSINDKGELQCRLYVFEPKPKRDDGGNFGGRS